MNSRRSETAGGFAGFVLICVGVDVNMAAENETPTYTLLNLPLWARVLSILGFPTVVACVLLGVLLGWVKSPLTEIVILQQKEVDVLNSLITASMSTRREGLAALEYQNILLRTLCRAVSKSDQQMLSCEPRYRGYEEENKGVK